MRSALPRESQSSGPNLLDVIFHPRKPCVPLDVSVVLSISHYNFFRPPGGAVINDTRDCAQDKGFARSEEGD